MQALETADDKWACEPLSQWAQQVADWDQKQRAEIERLRIDHTENNAAFNHLNEVITQQMEEIERLKAQLATAKGEVIWTTQKPTKPGAYWNKSEHGVVQMVVLTDTPFGMLHVNCEGDTNFENYGGEWQGPLEPKEPA